MAEIPAGGMPSFGSSGRNGGVSTIRLLEAPTRATSDHQAGFSQETKQALKLIRPRPTS